ncbi:MAG: hypothetical protein ICV54_23970 [Nostoc sp. C3-bin3]|nr:hypothetical protein [Nostoc sp. C3-bin3]
MIDLMNERSEEKIQKDLNNKQFLIITNIEFAVSQLSSEDLAAFRSWFTEFDAAAWDKQIEKDVAQQETLSSITDSPTLEPLTDLDSWTQSLIGVIHLEEENPTENYVDYLNDSFIGMWSDRQDLADSTAWVRGVRENEWSSHD